VNNLFEKQRELREILSEYRKKHDISLRQLEEMVGLSYSYLSKIERNEVIPPRDTVLQLADGMKLSKYQMLLSAGYAVDLERDLLINRIDWSLKDLENQLTTKYQIVATPFFNKLLDSKRLTSKKLSNIMRIDLETTIEIISGRKPITYELARNFCMVLAVYFFNIFRVKKPTYDVKIMGAFNDEEVALLIHRSIETYRMESIVEINNEITKREVSVTTELESQEFVQEFIKIPIYGEIKAGYGMIGEESIIGYEMAAKSKVLDGEHFYLLVKGDSMIEDGIIDGCMVLVRKQNTVENGKIGVVIVNGDEATLKRVFYDGDNIILQASNKRIPPRTFDISEVLIQGQVKSFVVDLE
jgi:SOS-response transcriptional repressor LexA/transcriptional regulator with XRE-family HTH domain